MRVLNLVILSVLALCSASALPQRHHVVKRQQAYQNGNNWVINTNLGQGVGVPVANGQVVRFVVKYAQASRFGDPQISSQWILPNINDPSQLPPACPQGPNSALFPNGVSMSEDCLYLVAYVPAAFLKETANGQPPPGSWNTYVWFHGGSFMEGGATAPGLDGSSLAQELNGIVVFAQYRLGVLGWLPPASASSASGNLGVKDATAALTFISNFIKFMKIDSEITIGGQSSGGHMVRALLASPAASGLFRAGTMHADPVDYGMMKSDVYTKLQTSFWSSLCNGGENSCATTTDYNAILQAQKAWIQAGIPFGVDPSVATGEPLRPHVDGNVVQYTLTTSYPSSKKPLFITSNKNDGGQVIAQNYPTGLSPSDYWYALLEQSLGADRATAVAFSTFYDVTNKTTQPPYLTNVDLLQQGFERVATDYAWRCANWDFARRWAGQQGSAYVALFATGATYTENAGLPYCTSNGMVCHEDEIYLIFGTTPNPTKAQTAVTNEVQARLAAFINDPTAAPNPKGYGKWSAATSTNANTIQFGGSSTDAAAPVYACATNFWGVNPTKFDWQLNGE